MVCRQVPGSTVRFLLLERDRPSWNHWGFPLGRRSDSMRASLSGDLRNAQSQLDRSSARTSLLPCRQEQPAAPWPPASTSRCRPPESGTGVSRGPGPWAWQGSTADSSLPLSPTGRGSGNRYGHVPGSRSGSWRATRRRVSQARGRQGRGLEVPEALRAGLQEFGLQR